MVMKKIILLLFAYSLCLTNSKAQSTHQAKVRDSLKILLKKEKQDTNRVMLLVQLSNAYTSDKPDTVMLLALEAFSLSKRLAFIKGQANSLGRIGGVYRVLGNFPKAMEFSLKALKLNEKIDNLAGIAGNLSNIGLIYRDQEQYHQAIDYFLKAKKLREQLNISDRTQLVTITSIGKSYLGLKQYDSARVHAQQAYEIASKTNSTIKGIPLSLMGSIYSETGQKKLSLEYYRLSLPYLKLAKDNINLNITFLGIAKLFEVEGQIDSTLFYANHAFETSRGAGLTIGIRDASSFLSSFYENRRNADKALFYHKVAKAANDSLSSMEKINQFQSLSFDEKIRQSEVTAAELKAKLDRKHNLQYAAIATGLIAFIILFFVLSRSIIVKTKFIEFFGVLGLLAVFEFINLFIHPYLAHLTNDSPVLMLGILIAIGALLIPFHHKLEMWITKVMVEKNKKIRLEAAKKTIASLEPN